MNFIPSSFDEDNFPELEGIQKNMFFCWKPVFWSETKLENMVPEEVWQKKMKISVFFDDFIHLSNFRWNSFTELEEIESQTEKIFWQKKILV